MGWLLIIGGVVWYFVWSGIGGAMAVKKTGGSRSPQPGSGDVPSWLSGVTLLGGAALVIAGIVVLVSG